MADLSSAVQAPLAQVGDLPIDALLSEAPALAADVTEHPVEEGADVSDNIRRRPDSLRIEGVITKAGSGLAPNDIRKRLEEMLDKGTPLTVTTARKQYVRMAMSTLDMPDEAKLGGAVRFSATFKQIRTVQTRTTRLRTPPKRTKTPAAEDENKGDKKVGQDAPAAVVRRSTLKSGTGAASDAVFSFFGGDTSSNVSSRKKKFVHD